MRESLPQGTEGTKGGATKKGGPLAWLATAASWVIGFVVAKTLVSAMCAGSGTAASSPFARAMNRQLALQGVTEDLRRALGRVSLDSAEKIGFRLSSLGIARLDEHDLAARASLLLIMFPESDSVACGRWSLGTLSPNDKIGIVTKHLDSAGAERWAGLTVRAMSAELRQTGSPATATDDDVVALVRAVAVRMSPSAQEQFMADAQGTDNMELGAACRFARSLYAGSLDMPAPARGTALRILVGLERRAAEEALGSAGLPGDVASPK